MLFTAFRKKVHPAASILGMILMENEDRPPMNAIIRAISESGPIKELRHHDERCMLVARIENYKLTLAHLCTEVFGHELQTLARSADPSRWKDPPGSHRSHIMLHLSECGSDPLRENELFSRLIKNLLKLPFAIGVYLSERSLLLPREDYLKNLKAERWPVSNWVFFGSHQSGNIRSAYTCGLNQFGKPEIEILDSTHSFSQIAKVMEDTICYMLSQNADLKSGEFLGIPGSDNLRISEGKGIFVRQRCLRIHF